MERSSSDKMMHCPDCGNEISENTETCPNCGLKLKLAEGISPGFAAFLGLVIGPFGYVYIGNYMFFVVGLIGALFLILITSGVIAPLLWMAFGVHQYIIAKDMKKEHEKRYGN